jgi:SAM-dependent methyltransferase
MAASKIRPHEWSRELIEFYGSTDAFLYETLCWNRSATKREMRRWIARLLARLNETSSRVLVYGDGLGFDSLFLAQSGHQVDFYEVSKLGVGFARRLFDDFDGGIRILTEAPDRSAHYDVIVCLDVLEHVPDPAALVQSLAACLRPGGLMIVHAPFWYLAPEVGTHLRSNRKFSGDLRRLFAPAELKAVSAGWFWNPIALRKESEAGESPLLPKPGWERLRIQLGGVLLAVGRYWNLPHLWVARWLRRSGRGDRAELEQLSASVIEVGDEPVR